MIPVWAIVLIVVIVFFGLVLGYLQYNRPQFFRQEDVTIGGNKNLLLGNIVPKREGMLTESTIQSVS